MNKLKALLLLLIINNNQTLTLNENTKSAIKSLALLSAGLVIGYMLNKYGRNIPNSALVALKPARVYTVSQIQEMKQSMKGYIESARKCSELCEETLIVEDNLKFSEKYALQKCFLDAFLLFIDYQYASHNNEKFKKIYEPYINNIKLFPCRLINKYFILKRNKNGAANKLITIAPNQTKEKLLGGDNRTELTIPTDAIYTLVQHLLLCDTVQTSGIIFQKKNAEPFVKNNVSIMVDNWQSDISDLLQKEGCQIGFDSFEFYGFDKDKSVLAPLLSDCCDFTFVVDSKVLNNHSAYIAMINKIFEYGDGCIFLSKRKKNNDVSNETLESFSIKMDSCYDGVTYHKEYTIGMNLAANCVSEDGSSHYYFIQKNQNVLSIYNPSANAMDTNPLRLGIFSLNIDEEPPKINEKNNEDVREINLPFLLDISPNESFSKVFAVTFLPEKLFSEFLFQKNNVQFANEMHE